MRCVVQRVLRGAVTVRNSGDRRAIGPGLVVFVGVHREDCERDADAMADKVAGLRIFSDSAGKMTLCVTDPGRLNGARNGEPGSCLVVSQFTLYGDARKGRRPSFIEAAASEAAEPLYMRFAEALRSLGPRVVTGDFGADMLVEIENDGPVTILLDSTKLF